LLGPHGQSLKDVARKISKERIGSKLEKRGNCRGKRNEMKGGNREKSKDALSEKTS